MKTTPELFEAFLKCEAKCWLRANGEPPSGNTYGEWVKTQNESYRVIETQRLIGESPTCEAAASPAAENLKAAKWLMATNLTARAETNSCELESSLHAVERVPSEGRGKAAQFIPFRFIFTNKLGKDDKLLIAFDALVLSEVVGREVSLSKIIHGDDHATLKVKTSALAGEVRKRLDKIAALLSNAAPPDLVLNRHCAKCEFQVRCRKIALEKDELTLLTGMSAKERQKLRSKGIFTVTQLSYTFRSRRRPKRLRDKREKYHHSLKALAIREKKIHIVGSPELKIEGTPVYLDLEGLPDRDFYYLIGVRIGNGESAVRHSLWADTVEDEGKIWWEFLGILETVEKPVLIHYGSYETNFLRRMGERYGSPLDRPTADRAIRSSINVNSFIFAHIYFPTHSNGLKEIGPLFGAKWESRQASGVQSMAWRYTWEPLRDERMKRALIAYNQDDCIALSKVAVEVGQIIENAASLPNVDFANAPKKNATEQGAETHATFERMLKSAHSDYSRSRVSLQAPRSANAEPKGKRVRIHPTRARKFSAKAGQTVIVPAKGSCSRHPEQALQPTGECVERRLIDLVFTKHGVRKTTIQYVGKQKTCPVCRVKFSPPTIRRLGPRIFGHRLQAWAVYQRIALRMPLETISRTMSDLFSENVNRVDYGFCGTVRRRVCWH